MVASKFKQMLQDENGVSPVIGVILMVAVTVVLGAVIGAFVFGIGDSLGQPAPNAQFDFSYDSSTAPNLDVNHDGGDSITGENTGKLSFSGDYSGTVTWDGAPASDGAVSSGTSISAGDDIATIDTVNSGETVKLQWETNDGGTSSVLGTFEAP